MSKSDKRTITTIRDSYRALIMRQIDVMMLDSQFDGQEFETLEDYQAIAQENQNERYK